MNHGFSLILWILIILCSLAGLGFCGVSVAITSPTVIVVNALVLILVAASVTWILSHHAAWPRPGLKPETARSDLSSWWGNHSWWVAAFLWGGCVCTLVAQLCSPMMPLMEKLGMPVFTASFAGAYPEEFLKAVGVVVVALSARYVTRPWHTFMVGFVVGLGFEVVENCYYSVSLAVLDPTSDLSGALTSWGTRMVLGVFLHPICTAVTGYGIGQALYRAQWTPCRRLLSAVGFYLVALSIHFLWNMRISNEVIGLSILIAVGILLYAVGIYFLIRIHREATADRTYAVSSVGSSWAPAFMTSLPPSH